MTEQERSQHQAFRFQDVVLTSADGQSIYATALIFFEDLALIEEAMGDYDIAFPKLGST